MTLQFPCLLSQSKFTSRQFGPKSSRKKEIKVWCPVDVKATLSHMIPHVTAETSEEFEGHEKF